ncbi:MAG TPA: carboxylesterase family protein [Bacteroidales bacterium]|nr:carboxylesterase family protein [Bacteroidales bacterium]HRX96674.1 carboxylesterase family protein [Bacteroidales bacterium]
MKTLASLLLLFFASPLWVQSQNVFVQTEQGWIEGQTIGEITEFLGVPFASPPIDDLRWRPPQAKETWTDTLLTIDFSPACPQKKYEQGSDTGTIIGDEDCLYLNIWTPSTTADDLPVLIFIHGGGNQQGSASNISGGTIIYNGKNLAERGNAVVVTIQYRLGPLGFLVHPGLEAESAENVSGNYGLLDQIFAMQWIQQNITSFGGDTSKILLFGESGGGVDVGNLLLTEMAAGLFSRACIQSAVPVLDNYTLSKLKGIQFANSMGCQGLPAEEQIACLRLLDSDSLVSTLDSPLGGGVVQSQWGPVIDNWIFNDDPQSIFNSGNFNQVPLIIGSNADEMALSAPLLVTPEDVETLFTLFVPEQFHEQGLILYPPGSTNEEARLTYIQVLTDAQFTSSTRRVARWVSDNQNEPVFRYFFTHTMPGFWSSFGSYHGLELFYVFNNYENTEFAQTGFITLEDTLVQDQMLNNWINFAETGNPNGITLESWPEYESAEDCFLEINANPESDCGLRTEKSDYWDQVVGLITQTEVNKSNTEVFRIYPNPVNDHFRIISNDPNFSTIAYVLFSSAGALVCRGNVQKQTKINVSTLNPGIYFLQIISDNKIEVLKLINE